MGGGGVSSGCVVGDGKRAAFGDLLHKGPEFNFKNKNPQNRTGISTVHCGAQRFLLSVRCLSIVCPSPRSGG